MPATLVRSTAEARWPRACPGEGPQELPSPSPATSGSASGELPAGPDVTPRWPPWLRRRVLVHRFTSPAAAPRGGAGQRDRRERGGSLGGQARSTTLGETSLRCSLIHWPFLIFITSEQSHFNSTCRISFKSLSLGELSFLSNALDRVVDLKGKLK